MAIMHFRITIPPNVKPGQTVRIRCPDGTEGDVRVPKNLKAGDDFIFEMSGVDEDKVREVSRQVDHLDRTTGGSGGSSGNGSGGVGVFGSKKKSVGGNTFASNTEASGKNAMDYSSSSSFSKQAKQGGGAQQQSSSSLAGAGGGNPTSFLDREIINRQDFLTALAVGMMIGLSIVGGFLVGVLLVTDPADG